MCQLLKTLTGENSELFYIVDGRQSCSDLRLNDESIVQAHGAFFVQTNCGPSDHDGERGVFQRGAEGLL